MSAGSGISGDVLLLTLCFKCVVQGLIAKIQRERPAKATNPKSPADSHDPRPADAGGPSLLTSSPCTMLLLPKAAIRAAQRRQPVQVCLPRGRPCCWCLTWHGPLGSSPCALFAAAPLKPAARRAPTGESARKIMLSNTVQVRGSAQHQVHCEYPAWAASHGAPGTIRQQHQVAPRR